jgi:hypothetical protein
VLVPAPGYRVALARDCQLGLIGEVQVSCQLSVFSGKPANSINDRSLPRSGTMKNGGFAEFAMQEVRGPGFKALAAYCISCR